MGAGGAQDPTHIPPLRSDVDQRRGAGIAAALPSTQAEAEYFGETSDAFKEQAKGFASEQTARAKTIAESVVGAVSEEARNQGLTIEGAKSAAGDMSSKVKRVLDAAGNGVSQRFS